MRTITESFIDRIGIGIDKFKEMCDKHNISWEFVAAIAMTESSGDAAAVRYEPHYPYLFSVKEMAKKRRITAQTEKVMQKMSWGPFQIMGALLREKGYYGPLTEHACDPVLNMSWALLHLKALFNRYSDSHKVAAAYNAGSPRQRTFSKKFVNQEYVDTVMRYLKEFKADGPRFTA